LGATSEFTDDHVVAHRCRRAGAVHPIKINGKPGFAGISLKNVVAAAMSERSELMLN
jgi:hypothetical protein